MSFAPLAMASYFGIQKVSEGTDGLKEHEIPIDIPYANLLGA